MKIYQKHYRTTTLMLIAVAISYFTYFERRIALKTYNWVSSLIQNEEPCDKIGDNQSDVLDIPLIEILHQFSISKLQNIPGKNRGLKPV